MTIRIGANPIGWSNDDMPEIGGDISLEQCLREAREAGFTGMELGNKFPREPKALAAALAPFGMKVVSGWYSSELLRRSANEEMTALRPHLDLLKAMGSRVLVFCETSNAIHGQKAVPLARRPVLPASEWGEFGRRLTEVAKRVLDEGVRVVYHHHMGTIVESDEEVGLLMAHTGPAVGLLYDTGHSAFAGGDPVALVRRHAQRIVHVHCKDTRPDMLARARREDLSFMQAVVDGIFTVPGDGCIDYPTILKVLADDGYAGWLVVEAEQDPAKAHPLTYARLGFCNLARLALQAGLTIAP